MTTPRTEDDGEAGILRFPMGGVPVQIRVLTIEESDEWQATLARTLTGLDVVESAPIASAFLETLFRIGNEARMEVLLAYDRDGRLGDRDSIRRRMSKQELAHALEVMVAAEAPFGMASARSVVEAFGQPVRVAARLLGQLADPSPPESSPSGPSHTGESPGPTSDGPGPGSSSSSDGPTPSDASSESPGSSGT